MIDPSETSETDRLDALIAAGEVTEEMRLKLSPAALQQAEAMVLTEPAYRGKPLRIYIEGKGCDGFYYGVAFDERAEDDVAFEQGSITLIVDRPALRFIYGSTVEWIDDERGRGFLVENPHHRRYRGKFYKRKTWQERLTSTSSSQ